MSGLIILPRLEAVKRTVRGSGRISGFFLFCLHRSRRKSEEKGGEKLDRKAKELTVETVRAKFAKANATFIAEYQGIKAVEMNEIRKAFRDSSVEMKILRNTLAKRAITGSDAEALAGNINGPVAIVFSYKDAAAAAKKLTEFAKEKPKLKIRAGSLGKKVISISEITALAELPPREVLLAKLLGSMKSPVTGLVCVLSGVQKKFLYALNAVKDAKAAEGA